MFPVSKREISSAERAVHSGWEASIKFLVLGVYFEILDFVCVFISFAKL